MELQDIIEEINRYNFDAIELFDDDAMKEIFEDHIKVSEAPNDIKAKYLAKLMKLTQNDLEDVFETMQEDELGYFFLSHAIYIFSKIRLGETQMDIIVLNNIDKIDKVLLRIDKLSEVDLYGIGIFLNSLMHFNWYRGELPKALFYANYALFVFDTIGYQLQKNLVNCNITNVMEGFQPKSVTLQQFKEYLPYFEDHNFDLIAFQVKITICNTYLSLGQINNALLQLEKLENQLREITNKSDIQDQVKDLWAAQAYNLHFLNGVLFNLIGDYEKSSDALKKGITNFQQFFQDNLGRGRLLNELAYSLYLRGEHNAAQNNFLEAIQIFEDVENIHDIRLVLFRMILNEIEMGEESPELREKLQRLKEIEKDDVASRDNYMTEYLEVYLNYKSKRLVDKFQSLEGFRSLMAENLPYHLELNILLHITRLNLIDVSVIQTEEKISNLLDELSALFEFAQEHHSYAIMVEIKIMKVIVHYIENDKNLIFLELAKIKDICEQENLIHLQAKLAEFETDISQQLKDEGGYNYQALFDYIQDTHRENSHSNVKAVQQDEIVRQRHINVSEKEYASMVEPHRLSVMKLLANYEVLSTTRLQKMTDIPKSTLNHHLKQLEDSGVIESSIELVNTRPSKVYRITIKGLQGYNQMKHDIQVE